MNKTNLPLNVQAKTVPLVNLKTIEGNEIQYTPISDICFESINEQDHRKGFTPFISPIVYFKCNEFSTKEKKYFRMVLKDFVDLDRGVSKSHSVLVFLMDSSCNLNHFEKMCVVQKVLRYTSARQFEFKSKATRDFCQLLQANFQQYSVSDQFFWQYSAFEQDSKPFTTQLIYYSSLIKQLDLCETTQSLEPQDTHKCQLSETKVDMVIQAIIYPYLMLYPELFYLFNNGIKLTHMNEIRSFIDFKMIQAFGTEISSFYRELTQEENAHSDEGSTLLILASMNSNETYEEWFSIHSHGCEEMMKGNQFQNIKFNKDCQQQEFQGEFLEVIKKQVLRYCEEKTNDCAKHFYLFPKPRVYMHPDVYLYTEDEIKTVLIFVEGPHILNIRIYDAITELTKNASNRVLNFHIWSFKNMILPESIAEGRIKVKVCENVLQAQNHSCKDFFYAFETNDHKIDPKLREMFLKKAQERSIEECCKSTKCKDLKHPSKVKFMRELRKMTFDYIFSNFASNVALGDGDCDSVNDY